MTRERQDISEDFYSGNYKAIQVTCYNPNGSLKDLTGAEVTYALFTNTGTIVLTKSSQNGASEIDILSPETNGVCVIYLRGGDTLNVHGTFRHHVNVVDQMGYEETVLTGKVNIFEAFAVRPRLAFVAAYLSGG
jgi:hypothetical protein